MPYDLRPFVDGIRRTVENHLLEPGLYRRWRWQDGAGRRNLGADPYGCADAVNLLYTLAALPAEPAARAALAAGLQGFQDAGDDLWHDPTHHPYHTTAHCTAALELLEARPARPLSALQPYLALGGIEGFLDGLEWVQSPWNASHQGAGVYAALVLAGEADLAWQGRYFAWLWQETDEPTGLWRRRCVTADGAAPLFHHLAGTFHYLFNLEYARRPLRCPERLVDTCLAIWQRDLFPALGRAAGFAEVDWLFCLNRAGRQCGHRPAEARAALAGFAERYVPYLAGLDFATDEALNDLHVLFGVACGLAELQQALPGSIVTERPLRLVLDRRPFI